MIMGVVYKNGKEISRGIVTGGKHWHKDYPAQEITICEECSVYHVEGEQTFKHDGEITFKEFQDNGNGWEEVYCSVEKVNRTKEYPLPRWFTDSNASIPNYKHKMNGKEIDSEHRGYIR
jgi:hypothetical protein